MTDHDEIDEAQSEQAERDAQRSQLARETGLKLAEAREQRKLEVADVAEELRTTRSLVQSMERGDWDQLGATVYARGYLGAYGRLVGTDVSAMDGYFQSQEPALPERADIMPPEHPPHWHHVHRVAAYVIATALVAAPALFWVGHILEDGVVSEEPGQPLGTGPEPSERAEPESTASKEEKPEESTALRASMTPRPTRSASERADGASRDGVEGMGASVQPATQQAPVEAPGLNESPAMSEQLVLTLAEEAWLEVSDASGERLAYGLMPANSVHSFPAEAGLTVRVGNADVVQARLGRELLD